jgi:hypothetical protein
MTQDQHPEQLTEDEFCILRVDALLDAIIDGRPWTVQDDLRLLLAGPFGGRLASRPPTHRGPSDQLGADRP